jgi:hypothetical protein
MPHDFFLPTNHSWADGLQLHKYFPESLVAVNPLVCLESFVDIILIRA